MRCLFALPLATCLSSLATARSFTRDWRFNHVLLGCLPRAANALTVDHQFRWLATDGGLARFRLNPIRP